ncbi:hypothetical protein BZG36_03463 [Bifiguratus adelaidae]|uniref:MalT-like TPR region domain-containing protein n=1 Tax=Bifiguratus adelaidae TaxID=1938954 RepID=A0A261XZJ8_9FUNG|nr:hypothetical protein BZG36_03463 [Bifiguratus adelaidae]
MTMSTATLTLCAWEGTHYYIEHYKHPTPPELPSKARNLLRGAYIREEVVPDASVARQYLKRAITVVEEEGKLPPSHPVVLDLLKRLAASEYLAGDLIDAVATYTKIWHLVIESYAERPSPAVIIESVQLAKKLGDLNMQFGEFKTAEDILAWALHTLNTATFTSAPSTDIKSTPAYLKMAVNLSLANLYAMQRQFNYAQPLYLRTLKAAQEEHAKLGDNVDTTYKCLEAIIQTHLSEVFYAKQQLKSAMGWAQKALETAKAGQGVNRDCDECAGVASSHLGAMLEKMGNPKDALSYYGQAYKYAVAAADGAGELDNLARIERLKEHLE